MKRSPRESYIELLKEWDKIHHLLGNSNPNTLYNESAEALSTLPDASNIVCVDIGAGNGILGVAAFLEGFCERLVLIEPLAKRSAFLMTWRLSLSKEEQSRVLIVNSKVEDVSRETLEDFAQVPVSKMVVMARAFSGARTLPEALKLSYLNISQVYEFFSSSDPTPQKFMLRPLHLH